MVWNPFRLLYPSLCRSCSVFIGESHVFCEKCEKSITSLVMSYLAITPTISMKVFAVSDYQEPLCSLVLRKNFSDRLAARQLAQLIYKNIAVKDMEADYIVPIPLHWTRYARRGFNQSYEMARVLSKKLGIPCLCSVKRIKRTAFQARLSRSLRQENLKGAFVLRKRYDAMIRNKRVLLVDDLCTTGATLKHVARELIKAEPQSINAVVACRVV